MASYVAEFSDSQEGIDLAIKTRVGKRKLEASSNRHIARIISGEFQIQPKTTRHTANMCATLSNRAPRCDFLPNNTPRYRQNNFLLHIQIPHIQPKMPALIGS